MMKIRREKRLALLARERFKERPVLVTHVASASPPFLPTLPLSLSLGENADKAWI